MTDVLFSAAVFVVRCPAIMDSQGWAFWGTGMTLGKAESCLEVVPGGVGGRGGHCSEQGSSAEHPSNRKVK